MVKNKILKRIVAGLSCIALSTTMLTSLPAFADDYVDEYQYYSTLDPNGEEYQEWKSNLASSAVSVPQNRMLKSILKNNTLIANDYIEFNTASNGHFTIGTIGGNPNSSTDDNKKMLFGHPGGGTSKTTIVVGESINEFTSSNVTYDADGSKSVSKASYDGVDVTQELSIIENSATGRDDVVKIKYIVKNDTEYAKQVGIRIMMDTMLGGNDAAPFRVNGSDVTTETVYSGSNIPQIWQAFDSATNPGVVAQGTFYKSGDRKPDKVQFTNWGNVTSTLWDYVTQPGRSNGDSAVSITWNKDTFTSGETREFVTYYGLSELEQNLIPPLALSVYADNKVSISNFNYDDINANVYLDNIGDGDATDVSIKITADNLEPKYGTSLTHNYSVIKPSKSYSIPLKFIVPTDSKHNSDINAKLDFELSYKVAKTGDTEVKRITKNITIPKLKRAVVVVPGIMGIDLAKTSNDESVWGSWIEQPSNFDDVKKIHNAFQSLKCDYYGNSNIELYPVNNYGYDDTYKGIIESLNNDTDISDKYDILFFPYDWRMGAQITANNLHDLISDYNEVVFVAHSMGGIVTEKYISEYGADNISKQITAGTPFWGAPTMLCVLSTGDLSYIIGGLGVAESLFTSFELPSVLVNLGSCYDLLPNKDYTDDWQWIYSYKRTYDHWYDYFIDNGNFTYFTFDEFDELISDDYNNYLWIDGKYNHSRIKISQNNTNNLKRIALVGSNRNTISTIQHCPGDRGLQFVPEYGIGDSVVPIESATMNFNHDLLDIKIFDQDHMGLIQSQECIVEILKNIKDTKSFMKLPMRTKMANNNLTSNAIEETKTLSNKLAISGYFDLFFSNETCSYYYTNSEVHEGNNFKFDPLTSVGNPILLAQFADDNYDCKINSLADQNTDIMCNIDGNIYLYTNISVNSGSVLFLNLSDGSFFINIDLDNDGEIDTTVTPTINPGVIQDDEKSPEITVESCNAGISNSNTINPNIVITNNSDKPLKMSDITINYVFNADNKENLEYHCDWLAVDNQYLGNTSVCEFVNDDYGNTYAKIKFNTDVELQPNKQFVIHFRLNAADWSNWDTSNDYSMGTEQLLPNDKIIVFYNEQLISGVQP